MTRPATPADGVRLLAQMPPERRENFSVQGFADRLAQSRYTWAGVEEDEAVVNIGGVMDSGHDGIGYVWQVIDPDAVRRNKRAYLRQGRLVLTMCHRLYPHLTLIVEPDNVAAQRHIRRLGGCEAGAAPLPGGGHAVVFDRRVT